MKDLYRLFEECKEEMEQAQIPFNYGATIEVSKRKSTCSWGKCRNKEQIFINALLLDDNVDDKETKDTIIHELIHTCDNVYGHDENFKFYGNRMNNMFGYHISRCNSATQKGLQIDYERMGKYKLVCENCGRISYKSRLSKGSQMLLKNNQATHTCGKCGHEMKTIILH